MSSANGLATLGTDGVTVRFGGLAALEDLTIELARNEILGLIGPNGAGKSTLINVLSGFQRVAAGRVYVDGRNITGRVPHDISRLGVARTFQAVRLFAALTVLENVAAGFSGRPVGRRAARLRAQEILDWIGLGDKAQAIAGSLPYGDERRVGIARALATAPAFLLLDEPAAGTNEEDIPNLISMIARIRDEFDCGVLVVEHKHGPHHGALQPGPRDRPRPHHCRGLAPLGAGRSRGKARLLGRGRNVSMLAVEDLAVRYGPIAALRGVSIAVDEGEFVGIVGPNGAGKSTLLFSITGAVKAETGSVSFCGETLSGLAPEDIVRRGMALVPEGRELFGELTVEENLRLGATIRRDRRGVEQDVRAQMAAFPILRERRRARAEKLSGGEQQMLAVARALMGRPRMLLLDEPSLGLAPLITRQVYQTLTGLNREGMTILVVEQNPARIIDVARRVYVLRSGRIARTGPPDILSRREELDEAYFGFDEHGRDA